MNRRLVVDREAYLGIFHADSSQAVHDVCVMRRVPNMECFRYSCAQVTWPVYFVELVRTLEEQRRREERKAALEEGALSEDSDGMLSDDDSSSSSDNSNSSRGSRSSRSRANRGRRRRNNDGSESGSEEEESEDEDEEDGEERDPLETLCLAFQAGEYHLLPLEMKVQALEYLVDRAMEVR